MAAKPTPGGLVALTAYVTEASRDHIRRQAFDAQVTASAIVQALLERHEDSSEADRRRLLARAEQINQDRRRRDVQPDR